MPTYRSPRSYPRFDPSLLRRADGPPKKIIVLGAGMAGLTAAYQLVQAGHDVTVIEARHEAGGRVRTLREPFVGGQHVEAGAMFLHGHHTLTMGYIAMMGLTLVPLVHRGSSVAYLRGQRLTDIDRKGMKWPVQVSKDEAGLGLMALWQKYIIPVVQKELTDPRAKGFPSPKLRAIDEMTAADFLRVRGASAGVLEILNAGYLDLMGNGLHCVSALAMLRDLTASVDGLPPLASGFSVGRLHDMPFARGVKVQGVKNPESQKQIDAQAFTILGGNDLLPHALAKSPMLKGRITYRAPIVRIESQRRGVRVTAQMARGHRSWDADYVISTIPFSVLRTIDLALDCTPAVRRMIDMVQITSVVRQYVQTRRRPWWRVNKAGTTITDNSLQYLNDQSINQPGPHGILEAYSTGPHARAWMALPRRERRAMLLAGMDLVYPGLSKQVLRETHFDWDDEPYARGGYASFEPGMLRAQLPLMKQPVGRFYFAGDATSSLPGWIQGAIESGHAVAEAVHRA
ncbi:MAG: FAD-dependent oxidoreductase [Gemmatimonadaceae bacterium]|nr:FAD-dependent oxidoreductase [Gemmatimonadaceae bacterium]